MFRSLVTSMTACLIHCTVQAAYCQSLGGKCTSCRWYGVKRKTAGYECVPVSFGFCPSVQQQIPPHRNKKQFVRYQWNCFRTEFPLPSSWQIQFLQGNISSFKRDLKKSGSPATGRKTLLYRISAA